MFRSVVWSVFCASLVLAGVAVPHVAFAQNLLTNPHFDTNVTGWDGGTLTFDATHDAAGSPSSGSALYTVDLPAVPTLFSQCVGAAPSTSYDYGGAIRPTVLPSGGSIAIAVVFFQGGACVNPITTSPLTPSVSTLNAFVPVSATTTSPPLTLTARITATFSTTGTFQANFDDVFFQPTAAVPAMPGMWFAVIVGVTLLIASVTLGTRTRPRRAV